MKQRCTGRDEPIGSAAGAAAWSFGKGLSKRASPSPEHCVTKSFVCGRRSCDVLSRSEEVLAKPENVRDKIIEGQLNKRFFGESVLAEQTWYRSDEFTGSVGQYLKDRGIELLDYAWYSVG